MIEPWLQDLVGIKYAENGSTPEEGFHCSGLARYIYRVKFTMELPNDPHEWRQMFVDLGKTRDVKPYDLIIMIAEDGELSHMGIACDEQEMIQARSKTKSIVIEPIERFRPVIRSFFRLK